MERADNPIVYDHMIESGMTPDAISKLDDLGEVLASNEAYRAGKVPKLNIRRTIDTNGNLKREKAMVYYGESFDEALIRESSKQRIGE